MSFFSKCRTCGKELDPNDRWTGFCSLSCEMGMKEDEACQDCGHPDSEHRRIHRENGALVLCPGETLKGEPVPVSDAEDRDE